MVAFSLAGANVEAPTNLLILHVLPRYPVGVVDPFLFLLGTAGTPGVLGARGFDAAPAGMAPGLRKIFWTMPSWNMAKDKSLCFSLAKTKPGGIR